ncbi:hypothetical protein GOODEAATRI_002521 [Goodea atripinnis]|uniref:Uncharacterized protein n=1 Tax=Goodea atripinnis TaxID=208336 RepID=A0ABV0NIG4_9TELE
MERGARLHLFLHPATHFNIYLDSPAESLKGIIYGAISSSSTFTEHTHQCLPDGAAKPRHMAGICYLDVNWVSYLFWLRNPKQCSEEAAQAQQEQHRNSQQQNRHEHN